MNVGLGYVIRKMKKYICDICGCEMLEERHMIIPIKNFNGDETFNIKCFDHCGYGQADICKGCEDRIKNSINESITAWIRGDGLGYPVTDKTNELDKTELYFDDREICKFSRDGVCTNMNVPKIVNCDGYDENCHYCDMEKKTLSGAMVKESED